MTNKKPLSIVDSLRLGAATPGCLNSQAQLDAADTIENQEKMLNDIIRQLSALERRVSKLE